ncbi:ATP-binding cassette domain-containing protein [Scrofimicrobium sp. R131]|uniref:ATP-binding cassette domain-containing protein n=1 Tax=Scrofimicrobium appendicitidis TaxID=3079930 RepID=A0AAU7V816_9ACTO
MPGGLQVDDIRMGYGKVPVIRDLSLNVEPGQALIVTGANGAGKSTLLRGLAGLQPMKFSSYLLGGEDCPPTSRAHRQLTHSIFDDWAWLPELTVGDHLLLASKSQRSSSVEVALDLFGAAHLIRRLPHSLSTGQERRCALASMIVRPWSFLFLDEPERGLDEEYQEVLAEALGAILGQRSVVLATHRPELFADLPAQRLHLAGDNS